MRVGLFACVSLVALCLGVSAVADDAKKDSDKLQGKWSVESGQRGGQPAPAELVERLKFTFEGDKLKVVTGEREREATVKLDPSKSPKEIDLKPSDGEKALLGIYKIEDGKFHLAIGEPGEERPKEFASKEGSRAMYFVMKKD
jgi:uncharacterized protein (TIGR03067 family)